MHFLLESGVYAIEKGKKEKQDPVERGVRTLEGTVKMYQNLIKDYPEQEVPGMEVLVNLSKAKKLKAYVKEKIEARKDAEVRYEEM